jgi:hypothetical protein
MIESNPTRLNMDVDWTAFSSAWSFPAGLPANRGSGRRALRVTTFSTEAPQTAPQRKPPSNLSECVKFMEQHFSPTNSRVGGFPHGPCCAAIAGAGWALKASAGTTAKMREV